MASRNLEKKSYKFIHSKKLLKSFLLTKRPTHYAVLEDYPICEYPYPENDNSLALVWNEYIDGKITFDIASYELPTCYDCVQEYNAPLIAILDIALQRKGSIFIGFEIIGTNPISDDKIKNILSLFHRTNHMDGLNLYQVSSDWILNQSKVPEKIKYEKVTVFRRNSEEKIYDVTEEESGYFEC